MSLLFLAGCITSPGADDVEQGEVPVGCEPGDPSGNAPPIEPLRGDAKAVAGRIASALGQDLPPWNDERSDRHISAWHGDDLHIELHHDDGAWRVNRPERWPTDSDQLKAFIDALGASVRVEHGQDGSVFQFVQTWQGGPLGATQSEALPGDGSGRMGWWSGFTFAPLRDLSAARVGYSEAAARAAAPGLVRCLLDGEGKTDDQGYRITGTESWGIDVHDDSLVHQVAVMHALPEPGHCGGSGRVALIDAQTGGFLGWDHVPCA